MSQPRTAKTPSSPPEASLVRAIAFGHAARAQLTLAWNPRDFSRCGLLLWGESDPQLPPRVRAAFARGLRVGGEGAQASSVELQLPDARGKMKATRVEGWWLGSGAAAAVLESLPMVELGRQAPSVALWALASKLVFELVLKQRLVIDLKPADPPAGDRSGSRYLAAWRAAMTRTEDRDRLQRIVASLPGVARAQAMGGGGRGAEPLVLTAEGAMQAFLDHAVDDLMRAETEESAPLSKDVGLPEWCRRLARSLAGPDRVFEPNAKESNLPVHLRTWVSSATLGAGAGRPGVGFRLSEPKSPKAPWTLSLLVVSPDRKEALPLAELDAQTPQVREFLARMKDPTDTLLAMIGSWKNEFPAFRKSFKSELVPTIPLGTDEAARFITDFSGRLEQAGYLVQIPAALTKLGPRRLRPRVRVSLAPGAAAAVGPAGSGLLDSVINYQWEASLGDDTLTPTEFQALVKHNAPLVYHRGQWVAIDQDDVARLQARFGQGGGALEPAEALRLALAGEMVLGAGQEDAIRVDVVCDEGMTRALETLRDGPGLRNLADGGRDALAPVPDGIHATLRAYQERGFTWLRSVTSLGFGACLADDMGLGKTLQLITVLADIAGPPRAAAADAPLSSEARARFLIVCPTSVLGNWRREIGRFFPELEVVLHHGTARAERAHELGQRLLPSKPGAPVALLTSYALARRDCELLQSVVFDALVLDEAQNIKNPEAAQSQAVRQLRARRRVALTGTPVENRLLELWSIIDFLNPGLLGSAGAFKKHFATPIERYADPDAAQRLRRVTAPFLLRRMKTDPTIAPDLPEKITSTRYCPLTREQAALYQAVAEKGLADIAELGGSPERHGRILSMLTAIKQICNHPAQYLRDGDAAPRRSGKLVRFVQLLEEVAETGGASLVFTQFREMGHLLEKVLADHFGHPVPFLHGGLSRQARDEMVANFQAGTAGPILIISLRAGGTGLNLTRANHVFHYDRWWNPAVEDQASDRAYRIGQTRNVTVHQMISQDTLEEKTHHLLEQKRLLANRVIGEGETWLSELDDDTLRSLITLGQDAVLED